MVIQVLAQNAGQRVRLSCPPGVGCLRGLKGASLAPQNRHDVDVGPARGAAAGSGPSLTRSHAAACPRLPAWHEPEACARRLCWEVASLRAWPPEAAGLGVSSPLLAPGKMPTARADSRICANRAFCPEKSPLGTWCARHSGASRRRPGAFPPGNCQAGGLSLRTAQLWGQGRAPSVPKPRPACVRCDGSPEPGCGDASAASLLLWPGLPGGPSPCPRPPHRPCFSFHPVGSTDLATACRGRLAASGEEAPPLMRLPREPGTP